MANSAQNSISSASFQVPFEPHPIPYLPTDEEEESFVVLGKSLSDLGIGESPEPPVVDKSIVEEFKSLIKNELKEIDDAEQADVQATREIEQNSKDLLDGLVSMSSANSTELIQTKLEEIIQENNRLKDTIIQNNMSMKNQYERIQAWQKDVQEVHKAHKDKLFEAKEIIDKLKKDNDNLTNAIESLKKENGQKENEVKSLQDLIKSKNSDIIIEQLKKDNEGLKGAIEMFKKECDAKNKEILSMKEEIKKKSATEQEISTQTMVNMKQWELDMANNKIKDLECLKEQLLKDKQDLMAEIDELKATSHSVSESELTVSLLQRELILAKKQCESFQSQLADANQQIYILSHQNITRKESEDYETVRKQLMNAQMTITDLQQEKVTFMNDIVAKDQELKGQNDKVFALEAQLDVFKTDFEAERAAKESIKAEKDQMVQDLQHLQRRNQQLQEEIEVLRERNFEYVPSRTSSRSETRGSTNSNELKCPICQFGFTTFQALSNHVDRCVDINEALP